MDKHLEAKADIKANTNPDDGNWQVYIIECSDGLLYTGITTDIKRRWRQHSGELKQGAKFFRGRKPSKLSFWECDHSRRSALQREYQIKQFNRLEKQQLCQSQSNTAILELQLNGH